MSRLKRAIVFGVVGLAGLFVGVVAMEIFAKGISLSEMDWNNDGHVSFSEVLETMDLGVEEELNSGRPCRRVYRTKDGMTQKVLCP
jgi:hypothetical protein